MRLRAAHFCGALAGVSLLAYASSGYAADTTPPTTPVVTDDGAFTSSAATLHVTWTASTDPESPIAFYRYHIRVDSPGGAVIVPATQVTGVTTITRTGLTLQHGKTYYVGVRAFNSAGLGSGMGFSNGIKVDTTRPAAPGLPTIPSAPGGFDADGSYTVTWAAALDPESGIKRYKLQERIVPSGTWTVIAVNVLSPSFAISGRLHNTQYVYRVQALNGAKLWSVWSAVSAPVLIDTTAPSAVTVTDDGATTLSTTQLHATWTASSDAESSLTRYDYQIRQGSTSGTIIRDWTAVGLATELTATGLTLTNGAVYYLGVRAINGAGTASTPGFSNGITVVPPTLSVNVTPETWALGTLPVNTARLMPAAQRLTVTNAGNIPATFSLQLINPSGWLAAATNGPEQYVLQGLFCAPAEIPAAGQFLGEDSLMVTDQRSTTERFTFAGATQSGVSVPASQARALYLRFTSPTQTRKTTQQTITVTVTAQMP